MPIRRGEPWGRPAPRPASARPAASDAEIAALAGACGPLLVTGGDLWRSIGMPGDRDPVQLLPIDLLDVTIDGTARVASAHVIARRGWWHGPIVAVLNVGAVGSWDVAPRAHPNDGRFDIVEVDPSMSLRERWQARGRLPLGTHVPHPAIDTRTDTAASWRFDRPMRIWVDGQPVGDGRSLDVAIRPDAVTIAA